MDQRLSIPGILNKKRRGEKITMLTAYDDSYISFHYTFAIVVVTIIAICKSI